jgi:hypothetical protein
MFDSLRAAVIGKNMGSRRRGRITRKPWIEPLEGRELPAALLLPETVPPSFSATSTLTNGDSLLHSGGNFLGSLNGNIPLEVSYSVDITTNIEIFAGTGAYPNAAVTADGTTYGSAVPNAGAISWLITNLGPTATTPLQQDALQAAIWRTEYGDGFQLDGVDNGRVAHSDTNAKIAAIYQADVAALGTNTAPVSAVSWISPGTTGFSTHHGPGLVALAGQPIAEVPASLALPQSQLPTFSATFPINEGGQVLQSGEDLSGGNFGGMLNGTTPLTVSYCVNLYTDLFPGTTYANAAVTADGTSYANPLPNAGAIAWLITNLGPTATTPLQQDALQAAIWRTEYGANFQLNGVDNQDGATSFNLTIAPLYQADLAALGNNAAPVSAVVWISLGANPDMASEGQGLVVLLGTPTSPPPEQPPMPEPQPPPSTCGPLAAPRHHHGHRHHCNMGLAELVGTHIQYQVPRDETHATDGPLPVNLPFNVTASLRNLGTASARNFRVAFYLALERPIIPSVDLYLGSRPVTELKAFQSLTIHVRLRLPANLSQAYAGQVYLGMVIDPDNRVPEQTKRNNSNQGVSIDLVPVQLYDPALTYVALPQRFKTRQQAVDFLEGQGFQPTTIPGTDAGWSLPLTRPTLCRFNGRVMPPAAFRIQAGPKWVNGEWAVIEQGTAAQGEPSPRDSLDWGSDLLLYVLQYHIHF